MGALVAALDLGGTLIKVGIVDGETVLATTHMDAHSLQGLIPRLPAIEKNIRELLSRSGFPARGLAGIGIAIPGIVDTRRMQLLSVNKKYADAVGLDFTAWARKAWDAPVLVENDARAALAGEWQFGAGKGCDNMAMVTLGTGIGGAVLMEGKLLRGVHYQAGCLAGHFTINLYGTACTCGNEGCMEAEASSWRLPGLAREHPLFGASPLSRSKRIDYQELFSLAEAGDPLSLELVEHSIRAWSAGIITMIHAYDPELVVIGGGIMRSAGRILPGITARVHRHAWTPWGKVRIAPAALGDTAALLGVSHLLRTWPGAGAEEPAR